jgi:hypothetical protein
VRTSRISRVHGFRVIYGIKMSFDRIGIKEIYQYKNLFTVCFRRRKNGYMEELIILSSVICLTIAMGLRRPPTLKLTPLYSPLSKRIYEQPISPTPSPRPSPRLLIDLGSRSAQSTVCKATRTTLLSSILHEHKAQDSQVRRIDLQLLVPEQSNSLSSLLIQKCCPTSRT